MPGHALLQLMHVIHLQLWMFYHQFIEGLQADRQLGVLPTQPEQTLPGQWPESPPPSPIRSIDAGAKRLEVHDDDNGSLLRCPPVRLSEVARKHLTRNGRLPLIPHARYWPSWYQLAAKRKSSSLDYPSSEEEEWADNAGDHPPSILVRLSRRGEVYLQTRLQKALEDICRLQRQQQISEGVTKAQESQVKVLRQRINSAEAENQNSITILQQRLKSAETKYRSNLQKRASDHQVALADLRAAHKTQLNDLIENNLSQLEDLETEYEQEIVEKDERIKQLELQAQQCHQIPANSEIREQTQPVQPVCARKLEEELQEQKNVYESKLTQQNAYIKELEERCAQQHLLPGLVEDVEGKAEAALSAMLKEQVNEYQQKLAAEQNHNLSLREEVEASKSKLATLTAELKLTVDNANVQRSALQEKLEGVEKGFSEITYLLAQERQASNEKDNNINQLHAAHSQLEDLKNQHQETTNIISRLDIEHKQLQSENQSLKAQCTRYEQALDQKEREVSQLQGTLGNFAAFQEQMIAQQGELKYMDDLQAENKKLKDETRYWKGRYQNDLKNYQDLQKENAILHSRMASKGNPTTSTTTDSTAQERMNKQLQQERLQRAKAEDQVYRMSKQLGERDKELFTLRRLSTMSKRQVADEADTKVRTAKAQTEELEKTAKEERTKREDSKRAAQELQERLVLAESHLSAAQKHEAGLTRQHLDLELAREEVSCRGPRQDESKTKRKQEEVDQSWVKRGKGCEGGSL